MPLDSRPGREREGEAETETGSRTGRNGQIQRDPQSDGPRSKTEEEWTWVCRLSQTRDPGS